MPLGGKGRLFWGQAMEIVRKIQISHGVGGKLQSRKTGLDATDWWALSLGIAACAAALLIFAADADGAAAAGILVAASVLIATALQFKMAHKAAK